MSIRSNTYVSSTSLKTMDSRERWVSVVRATDYRMIVTSSIPGGIPQKLTPGTLCHLILCSMVEMLIRTDGDSHQTFNSRIVCRCWCKNIGAVIADMSSSLRKR